MASLDHPYCCPLVDKCINQMKEEVIDQIQDLLLTNNPLTSSVCDLPKEVHEELTERARDLYEPIEELFEELRSEFETMRSNADAQLTEIEGELEDALEELREYEENN